jgi:hypothetical protein
LSRAEAAVQELKQLVKGTNAESHVLAWISRHAEVHEARHKLLAGDILGVTDPDALNDFVKRTLLEKLVAGLPVEFEHAGVDFAGPRANAIEFVATVVSLR